VVGGKSAGQNDELMKEVASGKEKIVMHTSDPGSPFCVIIDDVKDVKKSDLEECAVFCGCFSRAWKLRKRRAGVDIFKSSQIGKKKRMKAGTWGVSGRVKGVWVDMKLALIKQKRVLRGVPIRTAGKDALLAVCPGKIDKSKMIGEIEEKMGKKIKKDELMSALPAGGVSICK